MRIVHALLAAALLSAPAAVSAQRYSPTYGARDSWYIGFGVGGGGGRYSIAGDRVNFRDAHFGASPTQVALQFELGATVTPTLLLGGEVSALVSSASSGGIDSTLTASQLLFVATWFPMQQGLFLRGGVGLASLELTEDDGFFVADDRASGIGVLGGVGYAWWLGRRFNLTLHADVNAHEYGDGDGIRPDSSTAVNVYLGFRWY